MMVLPARVLASLRVLRPYCSHLSCDLVLHRPVPPPELWASPTEADRVCTAAQIDKLFDCYDSSQLLARLGLLQGVKIAIGWQRADLAGRVDAAA